MQFNCKVVQINIPSNFLQCRSVLEQPIHRFVAIEAFEIDRDTFHVLQPPIFSCFDARIGQGEEYNVRLRHTHRHAHPAHRHPHVHAAHRQLRLLLVHLTHAHLLPHLHLHLRLEVRGLYLRKVERGVRRVGVCPAADAACSSCSHPHPHPRAHHAAVQARHAHRHAGGATPKEQVLTIEAQAEVVRRACPRTLVRGIPFPPIIAGCSMCIPTLPLADDSDAGGASTPNAKRLLVGGGINAGRRHRGVDGRGRVEAVHRC
ncbi:hypothetical protein B0H14DRAFT_2913922 [Mycena olivaceomarginata]|nr:hypothetical protein B0H14DRAFT_2913922 [Mycena olivaceomarginata]